MSALICRSTCEWEGDGVKELDRDGGLADGRERVRKTVWVDGIHSFQPIFFANHFISFQAYRVMAGGHIPRRAPARAHHDDVRQ